MKQKIYPLLTTLLLARLAVLHASAAPKPNVLFLITDQQTASALSCAGNPYVKTPNLDKLAARGIRFEKSYCTYPLCSPSRGSLFTSRMPHELGINGNDEQSEIPAGVPTMGNLFRSAGYQTAYAGKWHLPEAFPTFFKDMKIPDFEALPLAGPNPHRVDRKTASKGLTADPNTVDAAIKFLRGPHQKPFLLVVSLLNPHDICDYPEREVLQKLLPSDPAQLPPARPNLRDTDTLPSEIHKVVARFARQNTEHQWREYLWVYYRLVEIADAEAGRVLAALDQTGLGANTVVVFTADHGEMMGSHGLLSKQRLYEEAAAVPLIIAPPGAKKALDNVHLVSGLDILPTALDYAGIAAPTSLKGLSLKPLVEGKSAPWRTFVASETIASGEARMIRTARYKYIVYSAGDDREQFFDVEQDPGELKNLIAASALAGEVARHRTLLEQWMKDTKDTFGKTPVPVKDKKSGAVGHKTSKNKN